jgi:hypothetical protein
VVVPRATTRDYKIGDRGSPGLVDGTVFFNIFFSFHHGPVDGEAVAPEISASSSSLAPQAAAISQRESSSPEG